jgi:hypothetical protein
MTLSSKTIDLVYGEDLDSYIQESLGRPWKVQQDLMANQNSLVVLEVIPDPEATAKVREWLASPAPRYDGWGRDEVIGTEALLSELCNRGLLSEGEMYVHVWW